MAFKPGVMQETQTEFFDVPQASLVRREQAGNFTHRGVVALPVLVGRTKSQGGPKRSEHVSGGTISQRLSALARGLWCALFALGLAAPSSAQTPAEAVAEAKRQLEEGLSPVGTWTIRKVEVFSEQTVSGPAGGAEAGWTLESQLDGLAKFEVMEDGSIEGGGKATYSINVFGGAAIPIPLPGPAPSVDIGGEVAGGGTRSFTISGQADLESETISLEAFEVEGEPLELALTAPGPSQTVKWPPWPPMTNLNGIPYDQVGATLLMRASGQIGSEERPFLVTFEAIKDIPFDSIFDKLSTALRTIATQQRKLRERLESQEERLERLREQ